MKPESVINLHAASAEELQDLAARIRPLPSTITPSPRFLEQMRLRLLRLEARPLTRVREAA